ncbi:hypothetical protein ACRQ5Q_22280 [Bradyrhizobium sp. PMVTL-01]|uniref:hypothetical protein n=1 Tax=Bradyrhizobium sp. PMVTL-01 TaxID=3434999 RepID=UPI003F701C41
MIVDVRPSEVGDVYKLAANLRAEDAAEVEALGLDATIAIRRSYRDAILRRSYYVDGELAAMSGLCGALLADIGEPYLMTTPVAERAKVSFIRCARQAVGEMLLYRVRLEGHVAASYTRACRLLDVLGFTLSEPRPFGPKGALFRTYTMVRT